MTEPRTTRLDPARLDELWDFGDPVGSQHRFEAALAAAGPAAGTSSAAELTTQLARALGLQGRFDEAAAVLDGLGSDPVGIVGVRVALERGRLVNSAGRPADAVPLFSAATEQARAAGDDFLAVDALHMLAIADPDRAQEWTRRGLGIVASTADRRTRRWAGSLRLNWGWTLHERDDFLEALRQFEAAVEAYQRDGKPDQVHAARWAMARALRSLGRIDEALEIQQQLLEAEPDDGYVHQELAELFGSAGRPADAEPHRRRAADLLSDTT